MNDEITGVAGGRTRRWVVVIALGLAALGVIAAGLVVALGRRDVPVAHPAAEAHPVVPRPNGTAGVVPLSRTPSVPSSRAPDALTRDDLSWVSVAGARVPVSAAAGPYDTRDGRALGFAHTSAGAVMAAVHISVRLSPQAGPAVFGPTLREQVVGDVDALARQLDADYQSARAALGVPYGQPAGRLYSRVRGYRVEMDGGDAAGVRLLIEGPGATGSVLVALTLRVRWTGTDWSLVAPDGGVWDATVVTDPTGYLLFPGGG